LAEPQAPTTGCSNPGTHPATFANGMPSETALTRTIRAALVPNRLRTTLHTVQNASRRTQSSQSVSFASLRFSLGCPLEVRERCVPVRLTEPRDTTSMSASVLVRLDHGLGSCLSAPISHGQRYVRPTFAILHFKDEHPVHRAATDCPRSRVLPLVGSVNDAVHAAIARFGQLTSFVEWAFSVPTRLRAPVPLTFPSPPKLCRHLCRLVSNDRDRLTASERDF